MTRHARRAGEREGGTGRVRRTNEGVERANGVGSDSDRIGREGRRANRRIAARQPGRPGRRKIHLHRASERGGLGGAGGVGASGGRAIARSGSRSVRGVFARAPRRANAARPSGACSTRSILALVATYGVGSCAPASPCAWPWPCAWSSPDASAPPPCECACAWSSPIGSGASARVGRGKKTFFERGEWRFFFASRRDDLTQESTVQPLPIPTTRRVSFAVARLRGWDAGRRRKT